MQQIADWLKKLGLEQYAQRFAENGIDVSVLRYLTDQDLEKIGVLLGSARYFFPFICGADRLHCDCDSRGLADPRKLEPHIRLPRDLPVRLWSAPRCSIQYPVMPSLPMCRSGFLFSAPSHGF
jgi:hypothetical protein